jgi:hypothetical protein
VNGIETGSMEQSWVNIFSYLRNNEIDVPSLNELLGFVLDNPGSITHTELFFR